MKHHFIPGPGTLAAFSTPIIGATFCRN
ncbi:hypothetical protein LINPERPRIM_LOCUS26336 [Linum perenne]